VGESVEENVSGSGSRAGGVRALQAPPHFQPALMKASLHSLSSESCRLLSCDAALELAGQIHEPKESERAKRESPQLHRERCRRTAARPTAVRNCWDPGLIGSVSTCRPPPGAGGEGGDRFLDLHRLSYGLVDCTRGVEVAGHVFGSYFAW